MSPIVVPITPYLDPPNFFVPIAGMKKSKTQIINAIIKVVISKLILKSVTSDKYSIKKPNQLVMGPGNIGKKLPIIPRIKNNDAKRIKNTSIKQKSKKKQFKKIKYELIYHNNYML